MAEFNWTCDYCNHAQTVTAARVQWRFGELLVKGHKDGVLGIGWRAIVCANDACRELTLDLYVKPGEHVGSGSRFEARNDSTLFAQRLLPASRSKPQPDYIPHPLREDYYEACAIADLSPKAAATLARRCLQGMIRDFCGISKSRLIDEITALRAAMDDGNAPRGVTHEAVDAIDHVRAIGNIGAHMEKDIGVIVPVDADEAKKLIELVEMLFEEWYVARHARTEKLAKLSGIAAAKKAAQIASPAPVPAIPAPTLKASPS